MHFDAGLVTWCGVWGSSREETMCDSGLMGSKTGIVVHEGGFVCEHFENLQGLSVVVPRQHRSVLKFPLIESSTAGDPSLMRGLSLNVFIDYGFAKCLFFPLLMSDGTSVMNRINAIIGRCYEGQLNSFFLFSFTFSSCSF